MNTHVPGDLLVPIRRRILLVEDNDAASRGLERILDAMGYEVTVVLDGTSALCALRGDPPPDFVLTDLRLPDLDGREVASVARQLVPRPRVALITGWDVEAAQHESARWGIDWIFTKPLNVQHLIATLRQSLEPAPGPLPQTDRTGQAQP